MLGAIKPPPPPPPLPPCSQQFKNQLEKDYAIMMNPVLHVCVQQCRCSLINQQELGGAQILAMIDAEACQVALNKALPNTDGNVLNAIVAKYDPSWAAF